MFHEGSEVRKGASIDEKRGVWTVKGKHGDYRNEGRIRVGYRDQRPEERGNHCNAFFCKGTAQNVSFVSSMRDRQSDGETCVEESGHEW